MTREEELRLELEATKLDLSYAQADAVELERENDLLEREHAALASQVAVLREALDVACIADKGGKRHFHDCVGAFDYPCKHWCDVEEVFTQTAEAAKAHDARVRRDERDRCAKAIIETLHPSGHTAADALATIRALAEKEGA